MQDLTPQLRTRLGRVERAVGLFVLLATLLLATGFVSYIYHTAKRKGWLVTKVAYCTSLYSAAGLTVGDPVKLMGFDVGEITLIDTERPEGVYNIYVEFSVREPYFGYLWTAGSKVRVSPTDFLGKRVIEVTKGTNYIPTHLVWEVREYTPAEALALPDLKDKLCLDVFELPVVTRKLLTPSFVLEDIGDFSALVTSLQESTNRLSEYLLGRFDEKNRERVLRYKGAARDFRPVQEALVEEFTRIIEGPSIYDTTRFGGVGLSEETRGLLDPPPHGEEVYRLNRLLLEQAYPLAINRLRRAPNPLVPLDRALLERMNDAGLPRIRVVDRQAPTKHVTYSWSLEQSLYEPHTATTKAYWLPPDESPALTDRLDQIVRETEAALPSFFALTNQLTQVLDHTASLTANADAFVIQARPLLSHLSAITASLTNADGALGRWLLPADLYAQTLTTLTNANDALTNVSATLTNAGVMLTAANTNLTFLVTQLQPPLHNLSTVISNLNSQVQANTNFVATLQALLVHTDELIQGFKRHWLMRSAFKEKPTNAPPRSARKIYPTPKGALY